MCHLFLIYNLTFCKSVTLKENTLLTLFKISKVKRPSTFIRIFVMGRSACPNKGGNRGGVGESSLPANPKISNFPLLLNIIFNQKWSSHPVLFLITDHILERKVSLTNLRQTLPNILSVGCIFSYAIMTYLKNLMELSPLIQNSIQ